MKQLWVTGPSAFEMRQVPIPSLPPGHALCQVTFVGLCGVDVSLWRGSSVYLENGLKTYPFVLGHEWSGTCVDVADDVDRELVGRNVAGHNFMVCGMCVACRSNRQVNCSRRSEMGVLGPYVGALSEYVAVPAAVLTPLPAALDLRHAALLEPAATAMHALVRTGLSSPDHLLVLGTGTLGLCTLLLGKALGATVTVAGIDPGGLELARALGADAAVLSDGGLDADRYTVVVEASGAAAAIQQVPGGVAPGGRIALVGVPNEKVNAFAVSDLVMKNVRIDAVYSGIHHWERLLELVSKAEVDLGSLIDVSYLFDEYDSAFEALASNLRTRPKILIRVNS